MSAEPFDAIVIGAGQGGGPMATALANAGQKTALIEREFPGGTCVNFGCTPTKTMIASGRVAWLANQSTKYGITTGDVTIDMQTIRQRKRDIVASFREGSQRSIDATEGLEYIEGNARFVGDKRLLIKLNHGETRLLKAETIIINVGERDRELDINVSADVTLETTRTIQELDQVPAKLAVIGSGPIALEFAQLFRRLGAGVTIIARGSTLLSREDPDIAGAVADILTGEGIDILYDSSPISVTRAGTDISISIQSKDEKLRDLHATHLLVASGRVPNTDTLEPGCSGVELDSNGHVPTNSRLETNVTGIYAIGDVRPGPKFTHISYDDYRVLKANLIDGEDRTIKGRMVPATTFIDPQLGRIGLSETEAKRQGIPYLIASMPMNRVARALETDETRGIMKVLIHEHSERILGAAILGIEGGEIASMLQIAMMGDLPYTALRDGVFAHPGLAEALNNLFGSLESPSP